MALDKPEQLSESERTKVKVNLTRLAKGLIERFGKVSTAFRAFDVRTRGAVKFADFAFVCGSLKLGMDRDALL